MVNVKLFDYVKCMLTNDFREGIVIDTGQGTGVVKIKHQMNTYSADWSEFDDGIWEVYAPYTVTNSDAEYGPSARVVDMSVHHPGHYNAGEIEAIDYIKQVTQHYVGDVGFCVGNVIKYLSRAPHKNGKQDLRKALKYLEWAVDRYEIDG